MSGEAPRGPRITVYTRALCTYCWRAKALLQRRGYPFAEIDLTLNTAGRVALRARSGRRTVPQVFLDGEPIGGFDELAALDASGELARRLAVAASSA